MACICLDPGHGGKDPGAVSFDNIKEKDITLRIATALKEKLLANKQNVVMTRYIDTFVPLYTRCNCANSLKADLFLSIHCNSSMNNKASGTETYCLKSGTKSDKLAQCIQKSMISHIHLKDRGVKNDISCILEGTNMPAALVELAFISNFEDKEQLLDPTFQTRAVDALTEALLSFIWDAK